MQERLIELSATYGFSRQQQSKMMSAGVGDVSQKGNWSCFRNELYEGNSAVFMVSYCILSIVVGNTGKLVTINGSFLSSLPGKGKLEFDFSGGIRPSADAVVHPRMKVNIVIH